MLTLRIALRNLRRNGRRTTVTATAVTAATALLVISLCLMDGMHAGTVHNATAMVAGEVEVHAAGYRASPRIHRTVAAADRILARAHQAGLDAVTRSYGDGLLALGTHTVGARFWGIDPAAERRAFELARHVARGAFLDAPGDGKAVPVVLGARLARSLHAEVGSEVAAIVQGDQGSMGSGLLRVTGILQAVSTEVDLGAAILRRADFDVLFGAHAAVNEIALTSHGRLPADAVAAAVQEVAGGAEVLTWRGLSPGLAEMLGVFSAFTWMAGVIFLASAALGVTNTMLMATFERFREFGVILALGGGPRRVLLDVATEALVLGVAGGVAGALLGLGGAAWLSVHGIELGGHELLLSGVAFDSVWRARVTAEAVVLPALAMGVICALASLYPAARAARLDPVVAMAQR
ncbi:MAG TPA: FtsX-like permease family protein [Anaeromyxobacteraceae bacterium]|nr:FtsX-like permease family protein [Anaeromyxobacteraceae bacterium]